LLSPFPQVTAKILMMVQATLVEFSKRDNQGL